MDRLGDLSQFDGHTKAPWNTDHNPWIFRRFNDGDGRRWTIPLFQVEKASSIDRRLATAAPDLLAALKESRKENEELRERIEAVKRLCESGLDAVDRDLPSPGCCETIAIILEELAEGKQ